MTDQKTPRDIAQERLNLAYEHEQTGMRIVALKKLKASIWGDLRSSVKSDTAAERLWEARPEGLEEMECRYKLKNLEVRISALKTMLEVMNQEARNQY